MTDKAPTIPRGLVDRLRRTSFDLCNQAATALEAAEARIAVLTDKLNLEKALSDGAHRRARTARREALEEAARVADEIMKREAENTYSYGDVGISSQSAAKTYCAGEIAAAIRALKGGSNG